MTKTIITWHSNEVPPLFTDLFVDTRFCSYPFCMAQFDGINWRCLYDNKIIENVTMWGNYETIK